MRQPKQILSMIMALIMIATCLVSPAAAASLDMEDTLSSNVAGPVKAVNDKVNGVAYVEGTNAESLNRDVTIMVELEGQTAYQKTGDLQIASVSTESQLASLARAEKRIEANLSAAIDVENTYSLLFNGFSFTGKAWMIDAINEMDGYHAFEAPVFELVEPESSDEISVTPYMGTSTGLTNATTAWELGYTGEGMVVAVIDTGIRGTHEAFSVMPENARIDMKYLEKVYAEYGKYIHAGTAADLKDIYDSAKLPFNWDYFDEDAIPNHTVNDHGTHVAGIVAGNNGSDFKGIAPDAQIVTMQVFMDDGGASFDTIMCALEDCVYLGVDAINMSLGSAAGFTSYDCITPELADIYEALENAGISVSVASGNDQHNSVWTNYGNWFYGDYRWMAANPDVGLTSSPATFPGSFCVASVQNTDTSGSRSLGAYGKEYYPASDLGVPALSDLAEGTYDIVYVGLGSPEEIQAAGGVEGKIALTKRGDLTFNDKCKNAAEAGAIAVIIFNNITGSFTPSVYSEIPFGALVMENGEELVANLPDGVHGKVSLRAGFSYGTIPMAKSSSWGTTADLRICPEIAAPGEDIRSCIGFGEDNSYATWSGTSMATPHISGGLMLVKQRLREEFPDADASKINELAYDFVMSTAHQVQGFVRQQGAGLMDVAAALTTDAYLTVPGANRPKLELDDSEDGTFTFTFVVNNIGDTAKTYAISTSILTEAVTDLEYSGCRFADPDYARETGYFIANPETTTVKTVCGAVKDVTALCEVTGPKQVTVKAGETATVEMTIACSDELMDYFTENCPSGMYLEGFVKLADQAEEGVDLSLPFLGYVGDWDYPSMLDRGYYWQIPYGENNYAQMTTSQGSYIGYGALDQGLGLNFYADMTGKTYLADRNAISPNGDGFLDAVDYMEFSYLRNPKTVKLYIVDKDGNVLRNLLDYEYGFRKEYWTGSINGGVTYSSLVLDFAAEELEENETAYVVLESWLDHAEYDPADNESGYWITPVTKDLTPPEVKVVDGGIEIVDANYTAYYAVYGDAQRTELLYETGVFADKRGVPETYKTDAKTLYVAVADYARNEAFYKVENGVVTPLDEDAFGHETRTLVAQQHINYQDGKYEYGWQSFNPETPNLLKPLTKLTYEPPYYAEDNWGYDVLSTAIAVDGTLYANDFDRLYTVNPETFERTEIGKVWCADAEEANPCNIMVNPETYEMYAYCFLDMPAELGGYGHYFCALNPETAEVTPLWQVKDFVDGYWSWAMTFMDGDTLIVYDKLLLSMLLMDMNDGTVVGRYSLNMTDPNLAGPQNGASGLTSNLLYDPDENCVYMTSDWSWFRTDRYNCGGILKFDFDTETATMQTTGAGSGAVLYGLYFAEDLKPADFYAVKMLIDAIGEVTLESGEAIAAARTAYDALSKEDKARVENYQELLNAEHQYVIMKAEAASFTAARYYALMILDELEGKDISGYSDHQAADYKAAVETFRKALEEAKTSEEIAGALDALFTTLEIVETSCPAAGFTDVNLDQWYHEYVDFAVTHNLMQGMGNGIFAPNGTTTRAQFVTILYRLAGEPSVEGLKNPFADVAADQWYTDAVLWACRNGITEGVSKTAFAPNASVTREQVAVFLYRYAQHTGADVSARASLSAYTDAKAISDYARDAMGWAVARGLIQGVSATELRPGATSTRVQIAAILTRYMTR